MKIYCEVNGGFYSYEIESSGYESLVVLWKSYEIVEN